MSLKSIVLADCCWGLVALSAFGQKNGQFEDHVLEDEQGNELKYRVHLPSGYGCAYASRTQVKSSRLSHLVWYKHRGVVKLGSGAAKTVDQAYVMPRQDIALRSTTPLDLPTLGSLTVPSLISILSLFVAFADWQHLRGFAVLLAEGCSQQGLDLGPHQKETSRPARMASLIAALGGRTLFFRDQSRRSASVWQQQLLQQCFAEHPHVPPAHGNACPVSAVCPTVSPAAIGIGAPTNTRQ